LCENCISNLETHPQPLLLKREGAKTSHFLCLLKVPLFVRPARRFALGGGEGFRVSFKSFNTVSKRDGNP